VGVEAAPLKWANSYVLVLGSSLLVLGDLTVSAEQPQMRLRKDYALGRI